eukprot:TRINITY_DN11213_c0_g1_i1.p1 TRINITY_DN11213_c0_g1~~TRINITY_DN11213_c0_g1_i1.p1  ORF type:complete len:416 (+),score=108.36 TRINITY_DN11213_c0_g1_i1:30-1277(+)
MSRSVSARAAGKLMLVGEWAVLEPGTPCVVLAVDRYCRAEAVACGLCADADVTLELDAAVVGVPEVCLTRTARADHSLTFVPAPEVLPGTLRKSDTAACAVEAALRFALERGVQPLLPLRVRVASGISTVGGVAGCQCKPGLGSSAAVSVAVVAAVLSLHCCTCGAQEALACDHAGTCVVTPMLVYKLAVIAQQWQWQKGGPIPSSGFDIAAAAYAHTLLYQRYDMRWMAAQLDALSGPGVLTALTQQNWPGFVATPLPRPQSLHVAVCFSGESASSSDLVGRVNAFRATAEGGAAFREFATRTRAVVERVVAAMTACDAAAVCALLREADALLRGLAAASGAPLLTPALRALADGAAACGAAGKWSGAGGGDCGIAAYCEGNPAAAEQLRRLLDAHWASLGLFPLSDLNIRWHS